MKTFFLAGTTTISFLCTYFMNLTMNHSEQYLAVVAVALLDGFFGVIAGCKREGFKTYKALKVLQTIVVWIIFLTTSLATYAPMPSFMRRPAKIISG